MVEILKRRAGLLVAGTLTATLLMSGIAAAIPVSPFDVVGPGDPAPLIEDRSWDRIEEIRALRFLSEPVAGDSLPAELESDRLLRIRLEQRMREYLDLVGTVVEYELPAEYGDVDVVDY